MKPVRFDVIVIGGGLAGITASYRLAKLGKQVALIDNSLPAAKGLLGGFAKFSGAKFSLLPAGQGLVRVAGSEQALEAATADVLAFLGLLYGHLLGSSEVEPDKSLEHGLSHRSYQSIVLTPEEIDLLLMRLVGVITPMVHVKRDRVINLRETDTGWLALSETGSGLAASNVIYAGGRAASFLLRTAGAAAQDGKGFDVGVRVEFVNKEAISELRSLGPDAKILHRDCRTFCLNSPGRVYRYDYEDITIPGGVVAEGTHPAANVGLLYRTRARMTFRQKVLDSMRQIAKEVYEQAPVTSRASFDDKEEMIRAVYGAEIADALQDFAHLLGRSGIVQWDAPHRIHFPLLDWHWDTFAVEYSHKTSKHALWVAGDCAGHARGLLQAAISGWLAAEELVTQ